MPRFRIRIERLDTVPDTSTKWMSHVHADGRSDYVPAPAGATKDVSETVFDQTVEALDVAGLVRAINTPNPFRE